jgi:hypothetical protein
LSVLILARLGPRFRRRITHKESLA